MLFALQLILVILWYAWPAMAAVPTVLIFLPLIIWSTSVIVIALIAMAARR
jgi:hypothetical protein